MGFIRVGVFQGGSCPGGNFPRGVFRVGVFLGGSCPCGNFPGGVFLGENCPGGTYPRWEFSLVEVFRVGIVRWESSGWQLSG